MGGGLRSRHRLNSGSIDILELRHPVVGFDPCLTGNPAALWGLNDRLVEAA
jgi:hypothetical protein